MIIDSHVNLHAPQFDTDREAVIGRARAAGVGLMVTICDRLANIEAVRAISETHPDIWHTVEPTRTRPRTTPISPPNA